MPPLTTFHKITDNRQETKMAKFTAASAPELPRIACVGVISEVGDTHPSKSGNYNVTQITVEPRGGGIKANLYLLTRPEWLAPGFSPDVELEGNSSALFVYKKNINGPSGSGVSNLLGIAGSEEKADELTDQIFAAATEVDDGAGGKYLAVPDEALTTIIRKFVGGTIGYILAQKQEETGIGEDGKKTYTRTSMYEFDQFFYPNEASLKRYRRLAVEKPKNWRVGFDEAF